MTVDVVIVGAGLAGLCCARQLVGAVLRPVILEASDGVGGRIRTDIVDGFRLDRGFQVFLTSYPEARAVLNYEALKLRAFRPGACIRYGGHFYRLADPWRHPWAGLRSIFSPIGTLADKLRVARLRSRTLAGTLEDRFRDPETTTLQGLRDEGFSESMIERFFRPFLGGIFLERELQTSSRMFRFVFRMFSQGDACLPSDGMEAIPRQIASQLPEGTIRLGTRVAGVEPGRVRLENGDALDARAVVVATDGPTAVHLLGEKQTASGQAVTCLYFAALSSSGVRTDSRSEWRGPRADQQLVRTDRCCADVRNARVRHRFRSRFWGFQRRSQFEGSRNATTNRVVRLCGRVVAVPTALSHCLCLAQSSTSRVGRASTSGSLGVGVVRMRRSSRSGIDSGAMVSGRRAAEAVWGRRLSLLLPDRTPGVR
jgi:hypothetical protein